jgi:hypothetical protein
MEGRATKREHQGSFIEKLDWITGQVCRATAGRLMLIKRPPTIRKSSSRKSTPKSSG